MKRIVFFICALVAIIPSLRAYDFEVDGIYYNITDDESKQVEVTCKRLANYHNKYSGSIIIPSSVPYNGTTYSVTSIEENAFSWCDSLTSVTIPNSITSIEEMAFYGCLGLTSVTIPNSVTVIKYGTFWECRDLTSVTIPNSVTTIGGEAFSGCSGLTEITIPNSVTTIGEAAFWGCESLTSIYCCAYTPPPAADANAFSYVYTEATLYVPTGCKSAYQSTVPWLFFMDIQESDALSVEEAIMEDVTITTQNGAIVVGGIDDPATIEVYSLSGQLVYSGSDTTIPVDERGIYLVKVGNDVVKVTL